MMRRLVDNHRILVAAPSYLDRVGRPTSPQQMESAGHTFLRYGDSSVPWRLTGRGKTHAAIKAAARLRVDNGDALHDWALAGHGVMLKSQIDVAKDLARGRLERVLPDWSGGPAPIVALYPTAKHLPRKTRVFLDAIVSHLDSAASVPGSEAPA